MQHGGQCVQLLTKILAALKQHLQYTLSIMATSHLCSRNIFKFVSANLVMEHWLRRTGVTDGKCVKSNIVWLGRRQIWSTWTHSPLPMCLLKLNKKVTP
jgi:hypothetical protein